MAQFDAGGKPWSCMTVASEKRASNAPMPLPPTKNSSFVGTGL